HQRCRTSLLFAGRVARAEQRLKRLLSAFRAQDWQACFELVWAEFWDMHALFETSEPSFGYLRPQTLTVLAAVKEFWRDHHDGPLATLDAGPNVHLLWRADQEKLKVLFTDQTKELNMSCLHIRGDEQGRNEKKI
ncbi:MAG: hypothetical protein C5B49_11475, partial [Bdellovibrio sp.]